MCVFDQQDLGTVGDITFPNFTITCPANIGPLECTGSGGRMVTYANAVASDACDPSPVVACVPASGSTFPVGPNTVVCTATDSLGNMEMCSFTITIADSTAPTITSCPGNIDACSPSGAPVPVSFTVTATDTCDSTPTVTCTPASGSSFRVGTTPVSCTAQDDSLNTSAPCNFNVVVHDTSGTPTTVYVDDGYTGLPDCTLVNWPYTGPGPHIIGFDAFATIGGGITKVASGGTVNVAAGNYAESISLTKRVNLLGAKNGVDARGRVPGTPDPSMESIVTNSVANAAIIDLNTGAPRA
jgi:hypothetical protein